MLLTKRAFIAIKLTGIKSKEHRMTSRKKVMDEIRRSASPLANKSYHPAQHLSQEPTRGRAERTLDEEALDGIVYTTKEADLTSSKPTIEKIMRYPDGGLAIRISIGDEVED